MYSVSLLLFIIPQQNVLTPINMCYVKGEQATLVIRGRNSYFRISVSISFQTMIGSI